jgi:aminoglycoside/choline kinase family phosphotransferase
MHRDFQAQNILWKDGRARLVDFQGMRLGPLGYDAASLIFDPYLDLDAPIADALADRHRARLAAGGGPGLSPQRHRRLLTAAGLQRLMQALGAFAFLSGVKGRTGFDEYVPAALGSLRTLLAATADAGGDPGRLPRLERIVAGLS